MKLLVTILLLSIQAMPTQARGSKIISKLAEFLDWDSWSSEEEERTSLGQDQPHRFEDLSPDYKTLVFKPETPANSEFLIRSDEILSPFNQESNPPEIIALGPGRFYEHNNYIISTAGLEPGPDVKNAWGTPDSQYEDLIEAIRKMQREPKVSTFPVPDLYNNLANFCQIDHETMFEGRQINPLAEPLQNRKDSSAPHSHQSMPLFLDYSSTKCF